MTIEHTIFYIGIFIGSILIAVEWARYGFAQLGGRPLARLGLAINIAVILIIGIIWKNFPDNAYLSWGIPAVCFLMFIVIRATKPSTFAYSKALFRINMWAKTHYVHGKILEEKARELRNSRIAQNTVELLQHVINKEKVDIPYSQLSKATAYLELGLLYRIMNLWDEAESHLWISLQLIEQLDRKYPDKNVWDYLTVGNSGKPKPRVHQFGAIPLSVEILTKIDSVLPSDLARSSSVGVQPYPDAQMLQALSSERSHRKDIVDKLDNVLLRLAELNHVKGNYSVASELYKRDLAIVEAKGDHDTADMIRRLRNKIRQKVQQ